MDNQTILTYHLALNVLIPLGIIYQINGASNEMTIAIVTLAFLAIALYNVAFDLWYNKRCFIQSDDNYENFTKSMLKTDYKGLIKSIFLELIGVGICGAIAGYGMTQDTLILILSSIVAIPATLLVFRIKKKVANSLAKTILVLQVQKGFSKR